MSGHITLCLELDTVDIVAFQPLRDGLAERGVRFHSLAVEQARYPDTWLTRFAEMDNATRTADRFAPRTVEEIGRRVADMGLEPVGCIVADDGARLIGYTCFGGSEEDAACARQSWTGVRPEWRGCGVATALKIEGILLARQLGYQRVVTVPRADNVASIQMSRKVGFRPCNDDDSSDTSQ